MSAWVQRFCAQHGMHVENNSADGNCATESISHWLCHLQHSPRYTHTQIRQMVFEYSTDPKNGNIYGDEAMIGHLHMDGAYWGDGMLSAAAHCLKVDIVLITNYPAWPQGIMVFSCPCQNRPCRKDCANYGGRRPEIFIGHNHTASVCDHFVALLPVAGQTQAQREAASAQAEAARTANYNGGHTQELQPAGSKRPKRPVDPLFPASECKKLECNHHTAADCQRAACIALTFVFLHR